MTGSTICPRKAMILQQWTPSLILSKKQHQKIPLWVKLHKVPLSVWTCDGLSGIASLIGTLLYANPFTENRTRLDFARVCVEVEPLPDKVFIKFGEEQIELRVEYQWKPQVCTECGINGNPCTVLFYGYRELEY
ncbi:hypothetical protein Droror1_Dr00011852 [Drosera rotundifolia]